MADFTVQGWCPGARRPMLSGDGYLVRLRLVASEVTQAVAGHIARLSLAYGNGEIDCSARANLQLRGVSAPHLPALTEELEGLGLIDPTAEQEAIRNIMVSPLWGWDDSAFDIRPLAKALDLNLASAKDLQDLPGKFGFSLCGGGLLPLERHADIGVAVMNGSAVILAADAPLGQCALDAAVPAMLDLARLFRAGGQPHKRLGDWLPAQDRTALTAKLGLLPFEPYQRPQRPAILGFRHVFTGLGLPFGRIRAEQLAALAPLAPEGLRLTPWQALLVKGENAAVLAKAADFGLLLADDDPLRRVLACPGAPQCLQAKANVRHLAVRLAALVPAVQAPLHLSGCAKGCAHAGAAPVTLTATEKGFDLIKNGRARDSAALSGLAPEQLAQTLDTVYAARMER